MIKAYAMLRFMQREHHQVGGGSYIFANLDDYHHAATLFGLLNTDGGGQETKLTRREADIMAVIYQRGDVEFTIPQLQELTKLSYNIIHRCLHGHNSRGQVYSGLLDKCPAISFTDRTVVMDEEIGRSVRRRAHAYQFNIEIYRLWSSGGAVWLKPGDDDDEDETHKRTTQNTTCTTGAVHDKCGDNGNQTENGAYNNKINNDNSITCGKPGYGVPEVVANGPGSPCACEPGNGVHEDHNLQPWPPIARGTVQDGVGTHNGNCAPAKTAVHVVHLRPQDYKPLDYADHRGQCHACGRKTVDYIEKLTGERKSRMDQAARRICKGCYLAAVRVGQASEPPLPGTIVLTRMVRTSKDLGRCVICNLGKITYCDRETQTNICQQCYDREVVRANGLAGGGAGP